MYLNYFHGIWNRHVLFILTVFCGISNALNMSDITPMCLYYFSFDTKDLSYDSMKPPGGFCKSVATYSKYMLHPPREDLDVKAFKQKLPYVFVYNRFFYDKLKVIVLPQTAELYANEIYEYISIHEIDVLVLDFFDDSSNNPQDFEDDFQANLVSFCEKIRAQRKELMIGCKLHRNPEVVNSVLKFEKIDGAFNFYIINSYMYEYCTYDTDQKDMAHPPSAEQMQKTLDGLKKLGYKTDKMFLTVNVCVATLKNILLLTPEYWSNSWMCEAKPGPKRRYCRDFLENVYEQSKVVFDNKLAGVIVEAIDCDDFKDNCGCSPWPATQCICDGIHGLPIKDNFLNCKQFGKLPKER